MDEKIMKFLRKNNIHISNIKYLLRQENKTCIYMTDGRVVKTFITVKDLYEILIPYDYISINKGPWFPEDRLIILRTAPII